MKTKENDLLLGMAIKRLRKYKKIKANFIAFKMGFTESYYCRIEKGGVSLAFWQVVAICEILNCSLHQLCCLLQIDAFRGTITNWDEFFDSVNSMSETDKTNILALAKFI